MARVTLLPDPLDLMTRRRIVRTFPPLMICLAAKAAAHRLNHITRVGIKTHHTGLGQCFKAECGGGNLGLLVGCFAQICPERAPQSAKPEQRYRRGPSLVASIAEARTITIDSN